MLQTCEQEYFALECLGGCGNFLWAEATLAHFLDGHGAIADVRVYSLIDRSEAPFAYLLEDVITLLEQMRGGQQTSRGHSGDGLVFSSRVQGWE